jgi:hypothetical protein
LGLLLYFTWIERWLYMRLSPEVALERIYRRLYRLGRSLAGERTKAETAHEFMGKLVQAMDSILGHPPHSNYLSTAEQAVRYLTDMYQRSLFAHPAVDRVDVRNALTTWKGLRWRLLLTRLHMLIKNRFSRQYVRRSMSSVKP